MNSGSCSQISSSRNCPILRYLTCSLKKWTLFFVYSAIAELIGALRSNDADGKENVKKTIGFISKTTTLYEYHAFLYISLPVFARLRRENA